VYVSLLLLLFSPCAVGDRNDDLQCIKTFFKDVLHREVESVKNGVYENEIVNGCLITEYYVNGECNVWVSGQLHAIIHYWQEGLECPSSNVTQSVSQKTAFETALPIIQYHRLSEDQEQYKIYRRNAGPGIGDVWMISYSAFVIDGFPCVGRNINIKICAEAVGIRSFTYSHPLPVEPVGSSTISRNEAITRVSSWLDAGRKSKRYGWNGWIDNDAIDRVRRVIVSKSDVVFGNASESASKDRMYHCWEVPIIMKEGGSPPYPGQVVFIRVDTGDVLGLR